MSKTSTVPSLEVFEDSPGKMSGELGVERESRVVESEPQMNVHGLRGVCTDGLHHDNIGAATSASLLRRWRFRGNHDEYLHPKVPGSRLSQLVGLSPASSTSRAAPREEMLQIHPFQHPLHGDAANAERSRASSKPASTFGAIRHNISQLGKSSIHNAQQFSGSSGNGVTDDSDDEQDQQGNDTLFLSSEGWERADAAFVESVHDLTKDMENILQRRGYMSPYWNVNEVIPEFKMFHESLRNQVSCSMSRNGQGTERASVQKCVYRKEDYGQAPPVAIASSFHKNLSAEETTFISTLQISLNNPWRSRQEDIHVTISPHDIAHGIPVNATQHGIIGDDKSVQEKRWLSFSWPRRIWNGNELGVSSTRPCDNSDSNSDEDELSMPIDRAPCCT